MTSFNSLVFGPYPLGGERSGIRATISFPNGYGACVGAGTGFYTNRMLPYELAVLKDGEICYDTPVTEDGIVGYCDELRITSLLQQIEALPKSDEA